MELLRFADFSRHVGQNPPPLLARTIMATTTELRAAADLRPLSDFAFARPRPRNRVMPWLLLLAIWGIATSLLVLGAETATLIAAVGP